MSIHTRKQRGAILIMMAILIIVLIGIAALALDLGRLFIQRSELQNAADAAALAAAAELDSESGAQADAIAAAKQLLTERGIYFGDFSPNEDITNFIFYSSIGTRDDPTKVEATGDSDSVYVELTIDLTGAGEGIPFFFLPVLDLLPFVDNVPTEGGTKARALAGRQTYECFKPPMFMCVNDIESLIEGTHPDLQPGDMVFLKEHGGSSAQWTAGNFGFLQGAGPGADELREYLATAGKGSCQPAEVNSSPGGQSNQARWGMNTRMDIYGTNKVDPESYPPAPDIINYPKDNNISDTVRIGNGNWEPNIIGGYWDTYHHDIYDPANTLDNRPAGASSWSRYETYLWELGRDPNGNKLSPFETHMPDSGCTTDPNKCHGQPEYTHFWCEDGDTDCEQIFDDIYPSGTTGPNTKEDAFPYTDPDRRVIYIATLDCDAINEDEYYKTSGKIKGLPVESPYGVYVKMFLTEYVTPGSDPNKFEFYSEFIDVVGLDAPGETRVVIQLYE